jgi:RNA polymerase sigma-70 factor, ECF subfamily
VKTLSYIYIKKLKVTEYKFNALFKELYAPLVLYAFRILGDRVATEDIAQEAFVSVWRKWDSGREIKSLKSYLYVVALNKCLTLLRINKRQIAASHVEKFDRNALDAMIYSGNHGKDLQSLACPHRQCRKVFIMHCIQGMKVLEIAAALKLSIHTVNAHKARGILLLQRMLLGISLIVVIEALKSL